MEGVTLKWRVTGPNVVSAVGFGGSIGGVPSVVWPGAAGFGTSGYTTCTAAWWNDGCVEGVT